MIVLTLARKPLIGSVAVNVLKHGAGGINIDGCRVSLKKGEPRVTQGYKHLASSDYSPGTGKNNADGSQQDLYKQAGRWPANLILCHLPGCRCVGERKVRTGNHGTAPGGFGAANLYGTGRTDLYLGGGFADTAGLETVDAWDCQPGGPVRDLDQQSGVSVSTGGRIGNAKGAFTGLGPTGFTTEHTAVDPGFGEAGGASRFFKQVQEQPK